MQQEKEVDKKNKSLYPKCSVPLEIEVFTLTSKDALFCVPFFLFSIADIW